MKPREKREIPMTVHVTDTFKSDLQELADTQRRSLSSFMYMVLQDYISRSKRSRKRAA